MDNTKKPDKKNPRQNAYPISQLIFYWCFPLLWKGTKQGLNTDDLTICLKKDRSEGLGDKLETEWKKQIKKSKNKKNILRTALFRLFFPSVIFDGFIVALFALTRALVPVVLAQLLIQFQPQPTINNTLSSTLLINNNNTNNYDLLLLNRNTRSINNDSNALNYYNNNNNQLLDINDIRLPIENLRSFNENNENDDQKFGVLNLIPEYSKKSYNNKNNGSGDTIAGGMENNNNNIIEDDVIIKKVRPLEMAPPPLSKSERNENFILNTSREDFKKLFQYIWKNVYWLSSLLILMSITSAFLEHHADLRQRMVGARMRIACCSLIYRKTLRLSKKSTRQIGAGYLINLLSNDVSRLDYGFIYVHHIWILPFQACLMCYLIWQKVGWAAVVGVVGLLIKTIPVQTGLSHLSSILRMKVAMRTDERVGMMNEIIQGIQVIKMYAWEKPFNAVVAEIRRREVKQIQFACYLRGIYLSTMVFTERSTLLITILATILLGQNITSDIVFSLAQFYNNLQLTAAIFYPLALSLGAEAFVSINRIQDYLLMGEKSDEQENDANTLIVSFKNNEKNTIFVKDNIKYENAIELQSVSASWDDDITHTNDKRLTLNKILLNVKAGQLCAIIGPVGSGKSSLLNLILGEIPICNGTCKVNGTISYASQEPWLFPGTVRNNIIFGEVYEKKRYDEVIKCCSLKTDLEQLPQGDKTIVGERGTSLSGGQRARISLARAIYKQAKIYLLDDPLSAVDAHVGKHLFDEVIGPIGRLAIEKSTRLLVTHQVHFLKTADIIIIIENGCIKQKGSYSELANSDLDFAKLLQRIDYDDDEGITDNDSGCMEERIIDKHSLSSEIYDDLDIPYIDGYQELRKRSTSSRSSKKSLSKSIDDLKYNATEEEQAQGSVSIKVWKKYFRAGGNYCTLIILIITLFISQIIISGSDYFVNYWTQQEYYRVNNLPTMFTTYENLYIYTGLIFAVVFICIVRCYLFFDICMNASKKLHNKMFECLLNAPMRFFDKNPSGRILNRFSKDMGAIDELLPKALLESLQIFLVMIGILAMIIIVNPYMLVTLICSLVFYTAVLKLYLRPSQDLKRLEGITKSPVFSHLSASLTGLSTIRSRNLQQCLIREFDNLQDVHSALWQLIMSANTALGLWLDFISVIFVAAVSFSFIAMKENTFSGNVGLAISQSLVLTGMVQYGIRQTAESMQQMTCVERVLQYTKLEQEEKNGNKPYSEKWPENGHIQFKNMSLRYDPYDLAVLKNLQIEIKPKWKVGIVGRTGAGKSSLISALFRLSIIEGEILIDGIDTGTISLESLRSRISIIPQDPVLFSATIRYNLDPFNLYPDDALWRSLEDVELKQSISSLDYMVTECGSNFSVGQRQLICLARAILRNNKVLILDEATANVDPQTDALIQRTIRNKFKHCTVLTIAHRLYTVMDSDRILVMDDGHAKEFNIPHLLLVQPNSIFRSMVEVTGPQECELLKNISYDKFREMNENELNENPNM